MCENIDNTPTYIENIHSAIICIILFFHIIRFAVHISASIFFTHFTLFLYKINLVPVFSHIQILCRTMIQFLYSDLFLFLSRKYTATLKINVDI